MKIIKTLLWGLGGLLTIVVIAIATFAVTFDANQYKQELAELTLAQTGREIQFTGDIGLTLYPALGMKLGSMSFANAEGFGDTPMVQVNEVSASVDLFSLFALNPQIAQLVLDGLTLDLQKNAAGVSNWDDLVARFAPAEGADSETTPDEAKSEAAADDAALAISGVFGGLNISNANISWRDASAGAEYAISDLSLITGTIAPDEAFPLRIALSASSADQFTSAIELDTTARFSGHQIELDGLSLQTDTRGALLPNGAAVLSLQGAMNYDLEKQHLKLSGLKVSAKVDDPSAPEQGGLLPLEQVAVTISSDVSLNLADMRLGASGLNTRIDAGGGLLESAKLDLSGELGFDLNQQQLTLAVLDLNADLAGDPVPNQAMKVALSAPKLELDLSARSINLQQLILMLNENRFEGFVQVADYAQPAAAFELKSKQFDVDKLTGWERPPQSDEETVPASNEPAPDIEIALPMELLRNLKLDGNLELERIIAQGLTLDNLKLSVKANNGVIDISPFSLDLYDGSYQAAINLDARGDVPAYQVKKTLSGFQFGDFLMDFMQKDPVSGQANLQLDVSTRGDWLSKLKSNLNGSVAVSVRDGAITGFNLREEIAKAQAKLKRENFAEREVQKTDFSALSLSGVFNNGVFSSNDLNLQAPVVRVGGGGKVDLVEESLDYLVDAKLVGTTKGQDGGSLDELSGLPIPVKLTGAWTQPKIDVQLDEMLKAQFEAEKARISEQVAREKAELQKKLDAEKARLKAAQEKKLAAEREALETRRRLAEAEKKSELEAKRQEAAARLEAEKKAAEEEAKKKLEDKLKKLF